MALANPERCAYCRDSERKLEGVVEQVVNPYAPPTQELEHDWVRLEGDGYQLARLGQRWWGLVVDQLLFALAVLPSALMLIIFERQLLAAAAVSLVTLLPFAVYQFHLVAQGQSLGKRVAKTRVVRLDGSAPGFVHGVVLRNWLFSAASLVPGLGSIAGLVDIVMIFRVDRRTARDHVAGTRVIQS